MRLKKYIAASILLQYLFSFSISGVIYDENNNSISNALIRIESEDIKILSNKDGQFIIKDLAEAFYRIKISHIGYENYIKDLTLNEESYLKVVLKQKSMNLDRVVVTGTRSPRHIKEAPVLTHVISSDDIDNSSYSNVKDILEIAMPNVQMVESNHGNDRVKIQGLDNKYLTFLIDGDRVSGEYAGNIDFSMLGLSNVEKIEVIEGAMSTLYGSSAMGGVINIITKKNKSPYWFNSTIQYDDPIVRLLSMNSGFDKGIVNYNLNIHYADSDGYDLTAYTTSDMTLDDNKSEILSHKLILSPSDEHNIELVYKDYHSEINKYRDEGELYGLVLDSPQNRYDDYSCKMKYNYKISDTRRFKMSYLKEKYIKTSYYPYYYNLNENDYTVNGSQFKNGILDRQEINFQYHSNAEAYNRLYGLEVYNENYSSFNIYKFNSDSLYQSSIFNGENSTKTDKDISLYYYEERKLKNRNILSYGLRILNEESILLPSLSYLLKGNDDYNYRFSYSAGYRKPSIKELYYEWLDHAGPAIYGNSDLEPSRNNHFSISIDKRTSINDFSVIFYRNDIDNMISTEYIKDDDSEDDGELHYKNYDDVLISGINVHYYRKITDKINLRFVYNLTDASSDSDEILEGISKHAFRLSLYCKLLNNLDIIANLKYIGEKFVFDQEQDYNELPIIELSPYSLADLYLIASFNKVKLKFGVKNVFNYTDPAKINSEVLNNYDPGRRFFVEFGIKFEGDNNEK